MENTERCSLGTAGIAVAVPVVSKEVFLFNKPRGDEPQRSDLSVPTRHTEPVRSSDGPPASLGPSISITGNLSGNEDLVIEGSVEGEIIVRDHKVTISETGRVKADVFGRSICVEGQVDGNLFGDEQVVIRQSGRVRGNVTAPRVNLENGAKFKGSIDMQPGGSPSTVGTEGGRQEVGAKGRGAKVAVAKATAPPKSEEPAKPPAKPIVAQAARQPESARAASAPAGAKQPA